MAKGYFDGHHKVSLLCVGLYLAVLHGFLLLQQTGQLRPEVTTLVTCSQPDATRGYYVGRRDYLVDSPSHQRIYTASELVEELCQIAHDVKGYPDEENSLYYNKG